MCMCPINSAVVRAFRPEPKARSARSPPLTGGCALAPSKARSDLRREPIEVHKATLASIRIPSSSGVGYQKHRLRLCIRCLPSVSPSKAMNRRTALQDRLVGWASFLEFLVAAADFALTLNLKAAIVAGGSIVLWCSRADEARE